MSRVTVYETVPMDRRMKRNIKRMMRSGAFPEETAKAKQKLPQGVRDCIASDFTCGKSYQNSEIAYMLGINTYYRYRKAFLTAFARQVGLIE